MSLDYSPDYKIDSDMMMMMMKHIWGLGLCPRVCGLLWLRLQYNCSLRTKESSSQILLKSVQWLSYNEWFTFKVIKLY